MVINKFPNREVYEKIKEKGSLGADDVNVLEDYPGLEWKGEYSSTATYVKGDIVYYENMLYVMVSASVIGAIPGIDNDWIDFAKRSVTSSDVTNALGFTPADSTKVLPLSGGTLTGNLTGKYIIGTWLQATDAGHLATTPTKIPVFDDKGWIYYRTPAEILKDIGASSGYTLTEADKTEIAGKVVAGGTEFTLSDFPTALKNPNALTFTGAATGTYDGSAALTVNIPAGGSSGSGGALKAMSAVGGYIGIPAADLPENGVVWMCFGSGDSTELYTGTVTIQDAGIAVNDMLVITNGTVNPLNQVSWVSDGLAIYGLSANDYRGVYQVVGAGGAAEATQKAWAKIIDAEITEATVSFSKNGLPNVTELYIKCSQLANATQTDSAEWLFINSKMVSNKITKVSKVDGQKVFNWTHCKYNGLVWVIYSSNGAISNENLSPNNAQCPYNLVDNVGAATSIEISSPATQYAANTGKLEVWAR